MISVELLVMLIGFIILGVINYVLERNLINADMEISDLRNKLDEITGGQEIVQCDKCKCLLRNCEAIKGKDRIEREESFFLGFLGRKK